MSFPDSKRKKTTVPYEPNGTNRPPDSRVTIRFNGARIASTGNLTALCAWSGAGKSAVCEAICADIISRSFFSDSISDSFGLECSLNANQNLLYVDGERSTEDNWHSWKRILKRARIPITEMDRQLHIHNEAEHAANRVTLHAHCVLDSIEARINAIEDTIVKRNIGIMVLDGAGDLILDANQAETCSKLWLWLNSLLQMGISIFTTIHTNPNSEKARGHLGTELMRRAEAVLLLENDEHGVRTLTTDFQYGKVRNDTKKNATNFEWSEDAKMFITTEIQPAIVNLADEKRKIAMQKICDAMDSSKDYSYTEIKAIIISTLEVSDSTAVRYLKNMISGDYCFKNAETGTYSLNAF